MRDNVVFPVEIREVVRYGDIVAVFDVDRIFAVAATLVVGDCPVCRMPNSDSVFSCGPQHVAVNLEVLNAAHQINSPVFEASWIGNHMILQNTKIRDAALPGVRVNGGGRWTTRETCIHLDLAIAQSYVAYGGG